MQGKVSQEQRYEQFKLQWMIDHGYTLPDLIKQLGAAIQDCQYEVTDESTLQRFLKSGSLDVALLERSGPVTKNSYPVIIRNK